MNDEKPKERQGSGKALRERLAQIKQRRAKFKAERAARREARRKERPECAE